MDSNPDVDPTQLTGDSRSTKSFQGRQTCIDSRVAYLLDRGSHPVNTIQAKYLRGEEALLTQAQALTFLVRDQRLGANVGSAQGPTWFR